MTDPQAVAAPRTYVGNIVADAFHEAMRRWRTQRDSDPARLETANLVEEVFATYGLAIVAEARQPDSEALRVALQQMVDEFDNKGDEDHGEYPALCTACHALDAAKAALAALPSNVSEPPLLPCGHDPAQQWWGRCRKCEPPSDPPALDVERLAEAYHMSQLCSHGIGAGLPMQTPSYLAPDRERAALIAEEYRRLTDGH